MKDNSRFSDTESNSSEKNMYNEINLNKVIYNTVVSHMHIKCLWQLLRRFLIVMCI